MTAAAGRRRLITALAACAAVALVSGCNAQAASTSGGDTGFVSGDGSLTVLSADQRGEPIALDGELLGGGRLDLADLRGEVVVINIWGSWCGPCRKEAPELQMASERLADDGVRFVGLNTRDQVEPAQAFAKRFGIAFPSMLDPDGRLQLAFADTLPPAAIPSTLVLDRQGRVAARIIGPLPSESVLRGLAEDVVAEDVDAGNDEGEADTADPSTPEPSTPGPRAAVEDAA